MKKTIIFCVIILCYNLVYAQDDKKNLENFLNAVGSAASKMIDNAKVNKSKKKLEQMRSEGRPGADCYYIDGNGDLRQDQIDCYVGGQYYGVTYCTTCEELNRNYNMRIAEQEKQRQKEEFAESRCVDLGLPSGTKWYRGGMTIHYLSSYQKNNCLYKIYNNPYDDCYRLPTYQEYYELLTYCSFYFDTCGVRAVGPNGNSIYFMADGYIYSSCNMYDDYINRNRDYASEICKVGIYWTGTDGYVFYFNSENKQITLFDMFNKWGFNYIVPVYFVKK